MNIDVFFDVVEQNPFPGHLYQQQVDGIKDIIGKWERHPELTDLRWLAYILATTYHETGGLMQPIEEWGKGKGKKYGEPIDGKYYYGRGYLQVTWALWDLPWSGTRCSV